MYVQYTNFIHNQLILIGQFRMSSLCQTFSVLSNLFDAVERSLFKNYNRLLTKSLDKLKSTKTPVNTSVYALLLLIQTITSCSFSTDRARKMKFDPHTKFSMNSSHSSSYYFCLLTTRVNCIPHLKIFFFFSTNIWCSTQFSHISRYQIALLDEFFLSLRKKTANNSNGMHIFIPIIICMHTKLQKEMFLKEKHKIYISHFKKLLNNLKNKT